MKVLLFFCVSVLLLTTGHAGVVIDDFTVHPADSPNASLSAPSLGRNIRFLRQFGLDPKHVLGGTRSLSLNGYSAIAVVADLDSKKQLCRITFDKLCTGFAMLSYQGGDMGEARDLKANLTAGGAKALVIYFVSAPSAGTLVTTVYSGDKFQNFSQPIKAKAPLIIPFAAFKDIDFTHIDGITFEFQIPRQIDKKLVYEISRIEAMPLASK
jgi:hypothetical protein